MTQQIKVLGTKTHKLSLVLGTHRVEGKMTSANLFLVSTYILKHQGTYIYKYNTHTCIHKHTHKINLRHKQEKLQDKTKTPKWITSELSQTRLSSGLPQKCTNIKATAHTGMTLIHVYVCIHTYKSNCFIISWSFCFPGE